MPKHAHAFISLSAFPISPVRRAACGHNKPAQVLGNRLLANIYKRYCSRVLSSPQAPCCKRIAAACFPLCSASTVSPSHRLAPLPEGGMKRERRCSDFSEGRRERTILLALKKTRQRHQRSTLRCPCAFQPLSHLHAFVEQQQCRRFESRSPFSAHCIN